MIDPAVYFAFIIFCIPTLIFFLDYYPYTIIEYKDGYCKNMKTELYLTQTNKGGNVNNGIYYYSTEIYDKDNITYIGLGNGCVGTSANSYILSAGITNMDDKYPYTSMYGNVPTWLCGYVPEGTPLMDYLSQNYDDNDINEYVWPSSFEKCIYGSIKHIKKNPWNTNSVAQAGNYDYTTYIKIQTSNYVNLLYTAHCITTIFFMFLTGIIFVIVFMIEFVNKFVNKFNNCSFINDSNKIPIDDESNV